MICLSWSTALMTSSTGSTGYCWTHLRLRRWFSEPRPDWEVRIPPEVLRWLVPASSSRIQSNFLALSLIKHFPWTGMYPASSVPATFIYVLYATSVHVWHSMLPNLLQWVSSVHVSTTATVCSTAPLSATSTAFNVSRIRSHAWLFKRHVVPVLPSCGGSCPGCRSVSVPTSSSGVGTITFRATHTGTPTYLACELHQHQPLSALRSGSTTTLHWPHPL